VDGESNFRIENLLRFSYNVKIMALVCFNCGKGVMYGHNVSHAKNRTRKIFKPNLHSARIVVGGVQKRVKLCTKCQRIFKKTIPVEKVAEVVSPVAAVA
jgi:large subunit ribosomal protein L28